MHNPASVQQNETHKLLQDFDTQTDHLISARPYNNQQEKRRTCRIMDFAVPADHRVKLKESEKRNKYLDLGRELKKLWNMKVTSIVMDVLGTVTKGLIKGLEYFDMRGRVETIQTTTLLRSVRILETCCHLNFCESLLAYDDDTNWNLCTWNSF